MAFAERTTRDMVLLLTALLSHRALRGRRDDLGLTLRPDEERRLAELDRVFGATATAGTPEAPGRPAFLLRLEGRAPMGLPIDFRAEHGEWIEASLSNLSTSGFFVETATPRKVGEQVVFRFLDLAAGRAWQFAGDVEWVAAGSGMGLRFHGLPLELRLGPGSRGTRRLPIAA